MSEYFNFFESAAEEQHFYNIQRNTQTLYNLERRCSYPDYERSSRFCMDMLKKCGFEQVERIVHKADGKTSAFDLIMPQAWELCKRSFLEIVTPEVADYDKVLADTDLNPVCATIWSAPTPAGGITAEVVDYDSLDENALDVMGKIVFFTRNKPFGAIYTRLIAAGAIAIVMSKFTAETTEPDEVYWFNGLGNFGWYRSAEEAKLPIFSISPVKARLLKELLAQGPVTLHGEMNTRLYEGEIYTVTGIIPGESSEEYAMLAHMYEPFPGDDALGAALAAEIGAVLTQTNRKPRKTLRAVLSMELYGFAAYLLNNDRYKKVAAALSLDGFTHRCSPNIGLRMSPISSPFFGDFFYKDNGTKHLPDAPWSEQAGSLSDDTFGGDEMIGIPTNWLYNPSGVHHHNTGTGFLPDWELVKERFPMLADTALQLICRSSFPDYAPMAMEEFKTQIAKILADPEAGSRDKAAWIKASCQYEVGRLNSVNKFADYTFDEQKFHDVCSEAIAKLPPPEELSGIDLEFSQIVVERFEPASPSSLARIPLAERKVFSPGAGRMHFALFDGKRTLLEVQQMVDSISCRVSDAAKRRAVLSHIQYLAEYGYFNLKKSK